MPNLIFKNRRQAGEMLAPLLQEYKGNPDTIVLGLPRGGVVVAFEVARALDLPLDIIVSRKIGAPGNPEFAIGAVTEYSVSLPDKRTIQYYEIPPEYINQKIAEEKAEALRRAEIYRNRRPPMDIKDKTVILVDDGIATGATMRAAVKSARKKGAEKIVVAVPVLSKDMLEKMEEEADAVISVYAPENLFAVGSFYESFQQVSNEEVVKLLEMSLQKVGN